MYHKGLYKSLINVTSLDLPQLVSVPWVTLLNLGTPLQSIERDLVRRHFLLDVKLRSVRPRFEL